MTVIGKRVLIVDASITQKAKYVVPVIHPTASYITEFEQMEVAVGFSDLDGIRGYLGLASEEELPYDYCLLDIDSYKSYTDYNAGEAIKKYFVTSFDVYSLKKRFRSNIRNNRENNANKSIVFKKFLREEDEYLEFLAMNYNIDWEKEHIDFPIWHRRAKCDYRKSKDSKIKL